MSMSVMGLTVTRQSPTSANPSSSFTVTYTAIGDNNKWAVPIEETITGGCTPTSAKTVIIHDIGEATTLTKTYTFTSPSSGSCTFTGFWTDATDAKHNFANAIVNIGACTDTCSSKGWKCDSVCGTICGTCATGQTCTNGVCSTTSGCIINSDCKATEKCVDKVCVADIECKEDRDCSTNKICKTNKCVAQCTLNSECKATETCDNGVCKIKGNETSFVDELMKCQGSKVDTTPPTTFMGALFDFDCFRLAHIIDIAAVLMVFNMVK